MQPWASCISGVRACGYLGARRGTSGRTGSGTHNSSSARRYRPLYLCDSSVPAITWSLFRANFGQERPERNSVTEFAQVRPRGAPILFQEFKTFFIDSTRLRFGIVVED